MAKRSKIELPSQFSFLCNIPVRITDINYGGHVGNDSVLSIIHEARVQYLNSLGVSELNFGGPGLIMTDVTIEFKRESFYGDSLEVSVTAADFGRVGFNIYYLLQKVTETGERIAIAHAVTGMVCYDYTVKKVSIIPAHIHNRMSQVYIPLIKYR